MQINSSDDIWFKWLLSAKIEDNVAALIFSTLVDIYVDIRGFAFVSGCIEMYKNHKSQHYKRRALSRKNLFEHYDVEIIHFYLLFVFF